jgi:hypothetical protein
MTQPISEEEAQKQLAQEPDRDYDPFASMRQLAEKEQNESE